MLPRALSKKGSLTHNRCYRILYLGKELRIMSPRSKKEYIEAIFLRYKKASPKEKTLILNEFCATCGYHRKHAIRVLRRFKRFTQPQPKKRGRSPLYRPDLLLKPLKQIWLAANLPCSKRLKALLPLWLPGYIESFGPLPPQTLKALHRISAATIDRLLRPVRIQYQKRGRTTTKPGTLLRNHIPIQTNQWDQSRPGFLEADTVAHCGRIPLRHVRLYHRLRRYRHRLDRTTGRLGKRRK